MFLWISSNSYLLNLLFVRSHRAEMIIIVKRLIQGRNKVTRVRVEPRSCNQDRPKNDAFTFSATLPTIRPLFAVQHDFIRQGQPNSGTPNIWPATTNSVEKLCGGWLNRTLIQETLNNNQHNPESEFGKNRTRLHYKKNSTKILNPPRKVVARIDWWWIFPDF